MTETIRMEEFTGIIQNKIICVWHTADAIQPWLPTEFMLQTYVTRILIAGRTSPLSTALAADASWTQVWRSPGGKEWSCLLGVLQHMPGPILIVVGSDMVLTPKLVANLQQARSVGTTAVMVLRQPGPMGWVGDTADQVFFPVIEPGTIMGKHVGVWTAVQEWAGKANPRTLDLRGLLPQLASQGYALTIAENTWHWYKPADSPPLATLTVSQIAKQMQILGYLLEKTVS